MQYPCDKNCNNVGFLIDPGKHGHRSMGPDVTQGGRVQGGFGKRPYFSTFCLHPPLTLWVFSIVNRVSENMTNVFNTFANEEHMTQKDLDKWFC